MYMQDESDIDHTFTERSKEAEKRVCEFIWNFKPVIASLWCFKVAINLFVDGDQIFIVLSRPEVAYC